MPSSDDLDFLARGKRGVVFLDKEQGQVVKQKRGDSDARNTLENEARFLQEVNKVGIGPRFISLTEEGLRMEYIDGMTLPEYLELADRYYIKTVLKKLLLQLRTLEKLGINKFELTRPTKNVLVVKNHPILLDFERCRKTKSPKNISQFLQFLVKRHTLDLLEKKGIEVDVAFLRSLAATYKRYHKDKDFKTILDYVEAW